MKMIRHHDVAAPAPRFSPSPCINYHSDRIGASKQRLAIFATDCEKNNNRFVKPISNRRMRWMSALFH